jgi:hypothetical protein
VKGKDSGTLASFTAATGFPHGALRVLMNVKAALRNSNDDAPAVPIGRTGQAEEFS